MPDYGAEREREREREPRAEEIMSQAIIKSDEEMES
jgi:hypothetical protein